jgi:hypothetical protein
MLHIEKPTNNGNAQIKRPMLIGTAMIVEMPVTAAAIPAMCPTGSIAIARKLPKKKTYTEKLHCKKTTKHEHLILAYYKIRLYKSPIPK